MRLHSNFVKIQSTQKSLKRFNKFLPLYLMFLPVALYYILFCYRPMYGLIIAFQNYEPSLGLLGSKWVGVEHFSRYINNYYFWRILKNTFKISLNSILFGFPAPIILALMFNEIKSQWFKRGVQTITYLPHFISIVIICGMIKNFTAETGFISDIFSFFGGEKQNLLNNPSYFVSIYIISDIWQSMGWGSIIYIAALSGVAPELYEAAIIDGAGKWKQLWHVTIPGIMPTIVIMFILRMGSVLGVGYEKIILLYSPTTYKTADVISTYIYREGLLGLNWSYSAAVGLFNSIINFTFLITFNKLSKKVSETSLW